MKIAAVVLALTMGATVAHATTIDVKFSGTVDDGTYANAPMNTSFVPGDPISGSFVFNTSTLMFTSFQIGGYTAPGATTIYSPPLSATSFAYLGVEATNTSGQPTAELQLDFYYEAALPSTVNIAQFIQDPGDYSTDLTGGSPSQFNVFLTNSDGSVTTVGGLLTSYSVPEPGAMLLIAPALLGLAFVRRRFI
jgi:hypothetical protein